MKKVLALTILILLYAINCNSAPVISNIAGSVSNGQSITISGSGFGSRNSILPQFWDTVDNQNQYIGITEGSSVPVGGTNPWGANAGNKVKITKVNQRHPNSTMSYTASNQYDATLDNHTINAASQFYASWWFNPSAPVTMGGGASNKLIRVSNSQDEVNKTYSWAYTGGWADYVYAGNYCQNGGSLGWFSNDPPNMANTWNRLEVWFDSTTQKYNSYVNGIANHTSDISWNLCSPFQMDKVWAIGWESNVSTNTLTYLMDDIYIDNTIARIEICPGNTWSSRGKCEIQIPSAWSASSITATVNQGSFADGATAYLYVVDSSGAVNNTGNLVIFDSGTPTTPIVSSISGVASHNQTLTITGSGFGVKSPVAPLQWDPIDGKYGTIVQNAIVPTGTGYPWNSSGGSDMYNPTFNLSNIRGKFTAKYNNSLSPSTVKNAVLGAKSWEECAGKKLYLSYWLYPYKSISSPGYSNKLMRLTNDGGYEFGDKSTVVWGYGGGQVIAHSIVEDYVGVIWLDYGNIGAWNRLEVTVDNSTNPKPTVSASTNNVNQGSFTASASISDIKGVYTIGADWSNEQNNPIPIIDWGEIYIDNTLARVEICNASTKVTSTHCEIQIPQNIWNNTQIEIKVNQGTFPDGSSAYLYVLDETGTANSTGKLISFGESQADTIPPITTANPPPGTYSLTQSVSLSSNEATTIYFTTNGDTPTEGGQTTFIYTIPIAVSSTTTIKWFGKDSSGNIENINSGTWTISQGTQTEKASYKVKGKFKTR